MMTAIISEYRRASKKPDTRIRHAPKNITTLSSSSYTVVIAKVLIGRETFSPLSSGNELLDDL